MKIITGLLIVIFAGILLSSGCTSLQKNGIISPINGTSAPTIPEQSLTVSPIGTTLQESYADKIVGTWKVQTDTSKVLYWQFSNDGSLTGGSSPGSNEITGNWSSLGFRNLFEIDAASINGTGSLAKNYNLVIYYDIDHHGVHVQDPSEDRNWTFVRQ